MDHEVELRVVQAVREPLRQAYLRYWRRADHRGKLRLLRWAESLLAEPGLGVPTMTEFGFRLYTDSHDWVERQVLETGAYEPLTMRFLESEVRPGDTFVCSGAAYGLHLLLSSRAAGSRGRVIGIDPQPAALLQCRANLDLNTDLLGAPVDLLSAALMENPGVFSLSPITGDSRGNSSLVLHQPDAEEAFYCQGDTLENHLIRLGHKGPPDLAYLDIEGAEIGVLRSFCPDWRPRTLVIERNEIVLDTTGATADTYAEQFDRLGYEVTDIEGQPLEPGRLPAEENLVARAK